MPWVGLESEQQRGGETPRGFYAGSGGLSRLVLVRIAMDSPRWEVLFLHQVERIPCMMVPNDSHGAELTEPAMVLKTNNAMSTGCLTIYSSLVP